MKVGVCGPDDLSDGDRATVDYTIKETIYHQGGEIDTVLVGRDSETVRIVREALGEIVEVLEDRPIQLRNAPEVSEPSKLVGTADQLIVFWDGQDETIREVAQQADDEGMEIHVEPVGNVAQARAEQFFTPRGDVS